MPISVFVSSRCLSFWMASTSTSDSGTSFTYAGKERAGQPLICCAKTMSLPVRSAYIQKRSSKVK